MNNNRMLPLTLIQVVSAVAVVFLHTNGCFWNFEKARYWITANIIESVFYFAVPLFFMVTGATLIEFYDRYSIGEYWKRRWRKAVVPYIAWSLIAVIYRLIMKDMRISEVTIAYLINGLLGGSLFGLFWFFPYLFRVYISLPLFASVSEEKRQIIFRYLVIIGFLANITMPFIRNVTKCYFNWPYSIDVISGFLFYVLIGYLLNKFQLDRKKRILIYCAGLAGLLAQIIGTYQLSMEAETVVELYKGYNNLPCTLYSVAAFVSLKELGNYLDRTNRGLLVSKLGQYSFPIYLMHWFVMNLLVRCLEIDTRSILYRLGAPFIIIAISITITRILRSFKATKWIVP